MVCKITCDCRDRYETKINSMALFKELKAEFEKKEKDGEYHEIEVRKPLSILDDYGEIVTQWYPTKWYQCAVCGTIWAFEYPDFPAAGAIWRLNKNGERIGNAIAPER